MQVYKNYLPKILRLLLLLRTRKFEDLKTAAILSINKLLMLPSSGKL
jgi:hypothetical protein